MIHLTSDMVSALSWTLLHSLWQGLLVYMLLRSVLAAIPGNYASARYTTSVSALAVLTGAFIATFAYQYNAGLPTVQYTIAGITTAGQHTTATTAIPVTNEVNFVQTLSLWFNTHTQLIVNIYLAGMLLLLFRIVYNLVTLKNIKYRGTTLPDSKWQQLLNKCLNILNIKSTVTLLYSTKVTVPMVMGCLRPAILVPVALTNQLSTREAEAILLHELAHIRRNDYLVNMIQLFIETLLFYNPFVWLISSAIRTEREHCCDDMVVNATTERLPYAKALATLETFRQQPVVPSLAATGNNNQLLNRIKRIMEMNNRNVNYGQLTAVLLTIVLLVGATILWVPDVNAQSKKDKKKGTTEKTEKSATVKKQVIIESELDIDEDSKDDKKRMQKNVVIVKDVDTVKNYSINKTLSETDAALNEVFKMLEELNMEGIVGDAMAGVHWNSIGDSMDIETDGREISNEVHEALAKARKEMAEARVEMAAASKEYRAAMAKARKEISATGKDAAIVQKQIILNNTKSKMHNNGRLVYSSSHDHILDAMETDGLISREKGYKIEKKGDELYIDGIKQSKEVFKKYEPIIDARNLTITGSNNNISIKVEK